MGLFDSVMVPCPTCGKRSEFQSKSGDCFMATYNLEDCPVEVLADVNRHAPNTCDQCGAVYRVRLDITAMAECIQCEELNERAQ